MTDVSQPDPQDGGSATGGETTFTVALPEWVWAAFYSQPGYPARYQNAGTITAAPSS